MRLKANNDYSKIKKKSFGRNKRENDFMQLFKSNLIIFSSLVIVISSIKLTTHFS